MIGKQTSRECIRVLLSTSTALTSSKINYQINLCMILLLLLDCVDGWLRYRTGCIKFFTTPLTRMKAAEKCKEFKTSDQIKGNLIKIPSSDDNDQVVGLSPQSGVCFVIPCLSVTTITVKPDVLLTEALTLCS